MTLEKRRQQFDEDDPLPDDDVEAPPDPEPTEASGTTTVWACTECGRAHTRNNPPCSRCGAMTFRQEERTFDEDTDWDESPPPPDDDGPVSETMTVWVCTDCGRTHPRNNPPCSRCGGMHLEQREERFDDVGGGGAGWRDAVDWKVALGFVGAVVLAVLVVGPALGYFDLPGQGPPTVEDVPGESESVGGVALADVERAFVEEYNAARSERGAGELSWNRELGLFATYQNRWTVKAAYQSGARPSEEGLREAYRSVDSCDARDIEYEQFRAATVDGSSPAEFESADAMAAALVDGYVGDSDEFLATPQGAVGVDVHVGPDDRVFVTVAYC